VSRRAFVTGASGFIGRNIIAELLDQGWQVTALVRRSGSARSMGKHGVRLVSGDITSPSSFFGSLPKNCDVIFHVAGNTSLWRGNNDLQDAVNIGGTQNIVDLAIAAGVPRIVHTSSAWALGEIEGFIDEHTPSKGALSRVNYCRSKWFGEQELERARDAGITAIALRPTVVLGRFDEGTWARVITWASDGKLPPIPSGRSSFASAREVARAHVRSATDQGLADSYTLGGENRSFLEFAQSICRILGKDAPQRSMPNLLAMTAGAAGDCLGSITGAEPRITREAVRMTLLRQNWNSEPAIRDLGYRIEPIEKILEEAIRWLRTTGRIK
jgi:dihydroflavonol-4-reductase